MRWQKDEREWLVNRAKSRVVLVFIGEVEVCLNVLNDVFGDGWRRLENQWRR